MACGQFLEERVQAELSAFPMDIGRASADRIDDPDPWSRTNAGAYAKHLEGPLWEMRMRGKDGIARAAYVTATGRRVVVVLVFGRGPEDAHGKS
jgi:phage-related protein